MEAVVSVQQAKLGKDGVAPWETEGVLARDVAKGAELTRGRADNSGQVLLGDMGAGKSSLVRRFVKGQFFDYQESTIGAAFSTKTLPEHNVKFEIWDTAAKEFL
eukprot:jgi/Pico_ML_1/51666/g241.t2